MWSCAGNFQIRERVEGKDEQREKKDVVFDSKIRNDQEQSHGNQMNGDGDKKKK